MRAPFASRITTAMPGGETETITTQRVAALANPGDLIDLLSLMETVTVNGRAYTTTWDASTRTLGSTSPAGRRTTMLVDSQGRPAQVQTGDFAPTSYTYDARGRLLTVTQGQGASSRVAQFAYATNGYLQSLADPLLRTTTFTTDADGRVVQQVRNDGAAVRATYDADNNVSALTPAGRADHTFGYTQRDELADFGVPQVGTENAHTHYAYDADRAPLRIDLANGQVVQFAYDAAGRLSTVDLVPGTVSYAYDRTGRLASAGTSTGTNVTFGYDGGLLTSTTWSGSVPGNVTRTYDNDFHLTSVKTNGQSSIITQYDLDKRPVQVGDLRLTLSAPTGVVTNAALGAITDAVSYDAFGATSAYTSTSAGTVVYSARYTRDAGGRLTSTSESINGVTHLLAYAYDAVGRLSEMRVDGVLTASYAYDANGARVSRTDPAGITLAVYDAQDRLLQYGGSTYTNSASGDRLSKTTASQTSTYRYDTLGNLSGATLPTGTQVDYVLDGMNRRVGKKVNGVTVHGFLYADAVRPVAELDGNGNPVSTFVFVGQASVPAYMLKNGATYRIITDHLGSPRLVVDAASGAVVQRMDYDEFGHVTADTNPGFQPFGFAGGLYDRDTQLVHFGLRDYDPESGRWTTRDPLGFDGGDTNLYGYVLNDPINHTDPTGLDVNWACEGGISCARGFDELRVLNRQMTVAQFWENSKARALGATLGLGAVVYGPSVISLATRTTWALLSGAGAGVMRACDSLRDRADILTEDAAAAARNEEFDAALAEDPEFAAKVQEYNQEWSSTRDVNPAQVFQNGRTILGSGARANQSTGLARGVLKR